MLTSLRAALLLGGAALLVVAIVRRKATMRMLKTFLLEPSSPVNLALLRIFIFAAVLGAAVRNDAGWYAGLPNELRMPPLGWEWLRDFSWYEPDALMRARGVLIAASTCAMLGLFTRVSVPVAVVLAVLGHAVTMFFEKVNHSGHAAMLCALVLCFSACGDAFSLDRVWRWLRGQTAPPPSAAYGLPMRVCWLLLGTSYLFPGIWKLWGSGDLWISGARLRATLHSRWENLQTFTPPMRLDEYPLILALLGIATLVFEIGFIFALFNRVARVIAALSAVGFHLGVSSFLAIPFPAHVPLTLLLDFPQIAELAGRALPSSVREAVATWLHRRKSALTHLESRATRDGLPRAPPVRALWPAALAGSVLFSGQLATGFLRVSSWPISIFPTFMGRIPKRPRVGAEMRIEYQARDGTRRDLRKTLERMGPARLRHLIKRLAPVYDEQTGRTIVRLFEYAGNVDVERGDHIAIVRATWDLVPPGQQKNYDETLERRYVVTRKGALSLEYEAREAEEESPGDAAGEENEDGAATE
jgi:hypothetical protein